MANKKSFFLTGANAKIILNNKTVAFATDISYKIKVNHTSPRVLGRFEVEVHQPVSYDIEGSMTIIRYARGVQSFLGGGSPADVANQGSGIGSYSTASASGAIGNALGLPTADGQFDGAADEAFIPGRMYQSKMFDIEIRQKVSGTQSGGSGQSFLQTLFGISTDDQIIADPTRPSRAETSIVLLRDCRFTGLDFELSKKGVATQRLTFIARYVDDDTFIARKSGVGQELS